ncbi:hypothetical protein PQG02_03240 [Nostoc sp. UHCC 0926]|uniref:hypothetical protein n=1 Tax=unclassified Nostoc TaxID=2593658 RepID=UPI00235EBF85|nr:hypothetical protein [Nostoc sp. UHCC 0926]WDD33422.1 hypothetical protein PQG02_03240 [Nostoc sp. UHCC 0926]
MTQTKVRLWTVNEYHRMFQTGIITEDERVELLDGQVIPMSAINPPMQQQRCGEHPKCAKTLIALIP